MAAITSTTPLVSSGAGQLVVLHRLTNVNSGDTIDLSQIGTPNTFRKVEAASFISHDNKSATVAAISNNGAGQPTIVTLTQVGMAFDTVDLLAMGV